MRNASLLSVVAIALCQLVACGTKQIKSDMGEDALPAIMLDSCRQASHGAFEFYKDTLALTNGQTQIWLEYSHTIELDAAEYEFNTLFCQLKDTLVSVDDVLCFGAPSVSASNDIVLIPVVQMQEFDLSFRGQLFVVAAQGAHRTSAFPMVNSVAACIHDEQCYWVSSDTLYRLNAQTHESGAIAILSPYPEKAAAISLSFADDSLSLVYSQDIEEAVIEQQPGRKVSIPMTALGQITSRNNAPHK